MVHSNGSNDCLRTARGIGENYKILTSTIAKKKKKKKKLFITN